MHMHKSYVMIPKFFLFKMICFSQHACAVFAWTILGTNKPEHLIIPSVAELLLCQCDILKIFSFEEHILKLNVDFRNITFSNPANHIN